MCTTDGPCARSVFSWPRAARRSDAGPCPFGFTRASAAEQARARAAFLVAARSGSRSRRPSELARAVRIRPDPPRPRARRLDCAAVHDAGMEDVQITTHEVLLPRPLEVSVEMTRRRLAGLDARRSRWRAGPDTSLRSSELLPVSRLSPRQEKSPRRWSTPATAHPLTTTGWRATASTSAAASSSCATPGRIATADSRPLTAQQRGAAGDPDVPDPADDGLR